MKKYLGYYLRIFKLSIMTEMSYRANFWTWTFVHTISLLTFIVFFNSVYQNIDSINGWTRYQTLLVTGVGTLITGLGSLTFLPFMYGFSNKISSGELDANLTKPLNILFQSAVVWVDIEDLIVTPNAIILIIISLWHIDPPHLFYNLIAFLILVICSLLLIFSLITVIQAQAFRSVKVNSAVNTIWSLINTTKYPAKAIKNVSLIALTFLAPIAIVSSVPAEVLMGVFDVPWIIASLSVSVTALVLSVHVFQSALRHYSSASS